MNAYRPRRQSARWLDGDCPRGVLAILDNKGQTFDRYTVFYAQPICGTTLRDMVIGYRGMSEDPFAPQGFGIFDELQAYEVAQYRYRNKHHYARWSDLPAQVKKSVRQDVAELDRIVTENPPCEGNHE